MVSRALRAAAFAIAVGLLGAGCADDEQAAGSRLKVEAARGELIVYLEDSAVNVPAMTEGRETVEVVCRGSDGLIALQRTESWPFTDTDGGRAAPHVHTPLGATRADDLAVCALEGTVHPIEGVPSLAR